MSVNRARLEDHVPDASQCDPTIECLQPSSVSGSLHDHPSATPPRLLTDNDADVLVQRGQEPHQRLLG